MASTVTNYYALLVGIDMYLNDGSRKNATGDPLYLKNLQGCVNDVRAMREFLRGEFQVNEPHVLTSSVPTDAHSKEPAEPPELWPTFENIKHAFDTITEKAIAGDFFFFHFSGHGAQLQPTERSPKGRSVDSSLITMDYCNSNAAIRGWQLNEWLKRLNEKDVCIVVILDSCYSGGGWRTGANIRTPQGWANVPNNTIDEATITETSSKTGSRNSELESSWGINPKGFTLMAACTSDQQAEERQYGDEHRGAFTYSLLASLQQKLPHSKNISYRNLRDQVQCMLHIQTPRVYGRDRLLFFGNTEPFLSTPITAQIHADTIFFPMGKFHGVHERSEFMNYPSLDLTFVVNKVDDFQCSARILSPHSEISNQNSCEVVPSRWSLGSESLRVLVDRDLGNEFRRTLHMAVEQRIVGEIQILDTNDFDDHNAVKLTLKKRDDSSIDIYGPSYLTGYEGAAFDSVLANSSS
ncbi:caspase domain-containing protein [Penicillium expansum]|nr:caspase domain-containing protein [Penicillium expansum]